MGLNIKNEHVERLASEAAKRFGESKTEAIRVALEERLTRSPQEGAKAEKARRARHLLENVIWPSLPKGMLGRKITKSEREELLGYGTHGV